MKKIYKNNKLSYSLFSFICSIGLMLILFCILEVYPFGNNTLLIWDMDKQYASFMMWYKNVLLGNTSIEYSLSGGFGGGTFGLISYYLMSPFNFLLIFFDEYSLPLFVFIITVLKSALMSMNMQIYLYSKKNNVLSIVFSLMYSMSSYVICYQYNIMWMDSLVLLPLIILFLDYILENNYNVGYSLCLSLAIITNFFMGYIVCLFVLIYTLLHLFIVYKANRRYKIQVFIKFVFSSLLAGCIASFMIFPTVYYLQLSANKHVLAFSDLISFVRYLNPIYLFRYIFAGSFNQYQGITGGVPLIYCGVLAVVGCILYIFMHNVPKRNKVFYLALVAILLVSFVFEGPYLIWHGGYSPLGCPWRFSFLWSFVIIIMAYMALASNDVRIGHVIKMTLFWVIYGICIILIYSYSKKIIVINILCATLSMVLCVKISVSKAKHIFAAMLFLICSIELLFNAYSIHKVQFAELYETYDAYITKVEYKEEALDAISERYNDLNEYRTIFYDYHDDDRYNDGFFYDVPSLNMYSSTELQKSWDMFFEFGFGMPILNVRCDVNNATLLALSVAGTKYIIANEDSRSSLENATYIEKEDNLYINNCALPLAFVVDEDALLIDGNEELFDYQNAIYRALVDTNETVYNCICNLEEFDVESDEILQDGIINKLSNNYYTDGKSVYEEDIDSISEALIDIKEKTIELDFSDESKLSGFFMNDSVNTKYVCFSIPYEKTWKAYVDGKEIDTVNGMGGFLLVPIESGKHDVKIIYTVPLLSLGTIISCLSVFIILIVCIKHVGTVKNNSN